ncbi:MAG TPA: extracellular solute-binding protein, partial [Anaerolineae bacterium]|nr:extracellular solute-binding protein [Anaerolineae bacterium]
MSKRFFWLISLLVALTLVMSACGGAATPAPEQPAEEPAAEAPAATEEPAAEAPAATEEPAAEAPAATEEPAEAAATEEPAAEEPAAEAPAGDVTELNILWAQWDPADYLQEIGNMYEAETGIKVNVIQEPWGTFGELLFTELSAQGTSYDMTVGDSQWVGQAATEGHYVDLTDFLNSEGIAETVTPATLQY